MWTRRSGLTIQQFSKNAERLPSNYMNWQRCRGRIPTCERRGEHGRAGIRHRRRRGVPRGRRRRASGHDGGRLHASDPGGREGNRGKLGREAQFGHGYRDAPEGPVARLPALVGLRHHRVFRRVLRRAHGAAAARAQAPRRQERHVLRPHARRHVHLRGDRNARVDQPRAASRVARRGRCLRRPDRHAVARGDAQGIGDRHGGRHDRRDRRGAHLRRGPAGSEDVLLPVQPDGGLPALRV